jgi:hypothetical protein
MNGKEQLERTIKGFCGGDVEVRFLIETRNVPPEVDLQVLTELMLKHGYYPAEDLCR